ncbi:hypothetical protein K2173_009714 [Erythroxylum novogranatense]|uniref:RING-type E3 ubiquitin transferase n=1 Tax=Erythroxylum novogranatense TaxID=1862640 RepID=A0AAV8U4X3_9ROSI|nr:hypothetical protein K2173_009714 [Erythroxylum novogranatense]
MFCIRCQIKNEDGLFTPHPPAASLISLSSSSPLLLLSDYRKQSSSGVQISPAILFVIVILAVVFFISGLLHLLVKLLIKHRSSSSLPESNRYPDMAGSDAFQRQLQQLFHLHDSGLDQAFIDALPLFPYKEIMGLKEPFDCAVCLYEFSENDKFRLLPLCSHAFHIDCIDTWLPSNSTCPLCRGAIFTPGLPIQNTVFDLEEQREGGGGFTNNAAIGFSISQKAAERDTVNSRWFFSEAWKIRGFQWFSRYSRGRDKQ